MGGPDEDEPEPFVTAEVVTDTAILTSSTRLTTSGSSSSTIGTPTRRTSRSRTIRRLFETGSILTATRHPTSCGISSRGVGANTSYERWCSVEARRWATCSGSTTLAHGTSTSSSGDCSTTSEPATQRDGDTLHCRPQREPRRTGHLLRTSETPRRHDPRPIRGTRPGFGGRETTFVNTSTSIRRSLTPSTGDDASVFDGVSLVPGRDARDLERDTVYAEQGHRTRKRSIRIGSFKCFDLPDD